MNKKWNWIIGLFLFGLMIGACGNPNKEKYLNQIANLEHRTSDMQQEFKAIKVDTIGLLITRVMDIEFRIRNHFFSDTVAHELALKIDRFKRVRKRIRPIGKMYNQIEKGTLEELETLKKLKTDIESGSGNQEKYEQYLKFEEDKVKSLELVFKELKKEQEDCLNTYHKYHDELNAFSWKLVALHGSKKPKPKGPVVRP